MSLSRYHKYELELLFRAAQKAREKLVGGKWNLRLLPLSPLEKVPSDIEVSRSQQPKDVAALAEEIGILRSELELFGTRKAKVSLGVIDRLAGSKPGRYCTTATAYDVLTCDTESS